MTIIAARYITPAHEPLIADQDNGLQINMPSYPSGSHYDTQMEEYLDGGGIIADYDEFYDMSNNDIKDLRYQDNYNYMTDLIAASELNPVEGVNINAHKAKKNKLHRDTGAKHKNNKNKKVDDDIIDYQYQLVADLDAADDTVELFTARQDIIDWVPENAIWTVWIAPTP